jgi:hypothetical protein
MEPRPHERGNGGVEPKDMPLEDLLQWSHVLMNVETSTLSVPTDSPSSLQWSHVLMNVETAGIVNSGEQVV